MLEEKDVADVFTLMFSGPMKQTSNFCFVCLQPWVRVVKVELCGIPRSQRGSQDLGGDPTCVFPAHQCRSLRECVGLLEHKGWPLAGWWCWVIHWPLARPCVGWSCLRSCWEQESSAALGALWVQLRIFISLLAVVVYCQPAKAESTQRLLQRAENTRAQAFCGSVESCRGSCKTLRMSFWGSSAARLPAGSLQVGSVSRALLSLQVVHMPGFCSLLYLSSVLRCCAFCGKLPLRFPDVWSSIPPPLLSRQHWHHVLTAWLGL